MIFKNMNFHFERNRDPAGFTRGRTLLRAWEGLGPNISAPGPRRPRRVRFWRLIFLPLRLFCTHPFCTQPLKVTSELLRRSSLLEVSLKFILYQLLVSLRAGFCRKSVGVLLILGCLLGTRSARGWPGETFKNQYFCSHRFFLHISPHLYLLAGKTYKCDVTVFAIWIKMATNKHPGNWHNSYMFRNLFLHTSTFTWVRLTNARNQYFEILFSNKEI